MRSFLNFYGRLHKPQNQREPQGSRVGIQVDLNGPRGNPDLGSIVKSPCTIAETAAADREPRTALTGRTLTLALPRAPPPSRATPTFAGNSGGKLKRPSRPFPPRWFQQFSGGPRRWNLSASSPG